MRGAFAPLGPPWLPWENRIGRGQTPHGQTLRLLDQIGPVGRFGENWKPELTTYPIWSNINKQWGNNFVNAVAVTSTLFLARNPKILKFGHWTLGSGDKKMFKRSKKMKKKSVKNFFCRGNFTPFMSKSFKIWDHFFPLLLPKDSKNLKSLDIGLWEGE